MNYEMYWKGSPYLFTDYKQAHEYELAEKNYLLWLQGMYNMSAFNHVQEKVLNSLSNSTKEPTAYIEYPIPITDVEKEAEKERNIEKTIRFFVEGQKE